MKSLEDFRSDFTNIYLSNFSDKIITEILDLKYLFIETNSNVYYNTNAAPNAAFVSTRVQQDIRRKCY